MSQGLPNMKTTGSKHSSYCIAGFYCWGEGVISMFSAVEYNPWKFSQQKICVRNMYQLSVWFTAISILVVLRRLRVSCCLCQQGVCPDWNLRKAGRGLHNKISGEKQAERQVCHRVLFFPATAYIPHIAGTLIEMSWLALYLRASVWSASCVWCVWWTSTGTINFTG